MAGRQAGRRTDGQADGCMETADKYTWRLSCGQITIDGRTQKQADRQTFKQIYKQRQMDFDADRLRQTKRRTDRQTHTHTRTHTEADISFHLYSSNR